MSKVVDITDKLTFDENPYIEIKGRKYEVNADAKTVLEIMGAFQNKEENEASLYAYEMLFSEEDRRAIEGLKLPWKDLGVIINSAARLAMGEEESQGE